MFNKCMEIHPEFEQFVQKAENNPRCNYLGILDFLIMPIQRLPRFEMLMNDYLKHVDEDHPDYTNAQNASKQIKEMTSFVNEQKRKADSFQRILSLQRNIKGKKLNIVKNGRLLLREGNLHKIIGGVEKEIYVFLFNDLMIITKQKLKAQGDPEFEFKKQIKGSDLSIEAPVAVVSPNKRSNSQIHENVIKLLDKSKNEPFVIKFVSASDKKKWTVDIQSVIDFKSP